jgi:predicted HTH domain antitoxin
MWQELFDQGVGNMAKATHQLNLRISEALFQDLEQIAQEEQIDRTSVARKLLAEGVRRWRLEHALHQYEQGQITKGRAAELAGVTIYDILDEVRRRGLTAQYSLEEVREDLQTFLAAV